VDIREADVIKIKKNKNIKNIKYEGNKVHIREAKTLLSVASGSALQVAISSSYHDTVAPISVVGRLLWQARLPATRCQTSSVIRRLTKTF